MQKKSEAKQKSNNVTAIVTGPVSEHHAIVPNIPHVALRPSS